MADQSASKKADRRNLIVAAACLASFTGMVGLAYASVPLYRLFCEVTGFNGTVKRSAQQYATRILDQKVTVTFDTNVAPGLDWAFKPDQPSVTMRIGESVQVSFTAQNHSNRDVTGQALFNVTPAAAAPYFNKVQCFCFDETKMRPGESRDMPVVFYIDPAIKDAPESRDIGTITLSYTFYPQAENKPLASEPKVSDGKTQG